MLYTGRQFVPGSHLWPHSRFPKEEEAVDAEMKVGEALLFLGSTVHAGGGNASAQPRPVHGFFYCRSWMRPEVCLYWPVDAVDPNIVLRGKILSTCMC